MPNLYEKAMLAEGVKENILMQAKRLIDKDLGDLSDLPADLRNTVANIYYKNIHNVEKLKSPSVEKESYDQTDFIVPSMREMRYFNQHEEIKDAVFLLREAKNKRGQKHCKFLLEMILDIFKYRIPDAEEKAMIIRKAERMFRKSLEFRNLYVRMLELKE